MVLFRKKNLLVLKIQKIQQKEVLSHEALENFLCVVNTGCPTSFGEFNQKYLNITFKKS